MDIPDKKRRLSVLLKTIVILSSAIGTYLSVTAIGGLGGSRAFMYFTIQSNIAVALISAVGLVMLLNRKVCAAWYVIQYVGAVSITLTCFVFTFVLAPTLGDLAWTFYNILTHLIAPITFIIDFLLTAIYGDIQKRHILFVLVPPFAYVGYAAIGYAARWRFLEGKNYPYFFLNWGSSAGAFGFSDELPFMGCVWWIAALGALILLLGAVYLWIINKLKAGHKH